MMKFDANITPDKVIKHFESLTPTLKSTFNALTKDAKSRAFVVSRLTNVKHVDAIYKRIAKAVTEGGTIKEAVEDLKNGKNASGDKICLSSAHLKTIVNTNYQSAYAAGRWAEVQANKQYRPYLQYLAVNDSRTRDEHWMLNGKIYPVDDPFWTINMPPNGFNCRCDVRSLSERQVAKIKEAGGESVSRTEAGETPFSIADNPGFEGNPGITAYKPDLDDITPAFRERFLTDAANHFKLDDAELKKYFRDTDVRDSLILAQTQKLEPASQQIIKNAMRSEKGLTAKMKQGAEELGAEMTGLEYVLKSGESIKEKIARKTAAGFTETEAVKNMHDLVRYTQQSPHNEIAGNVKKTVDKLKTSGYTIAEVDNKYLNPNAPYKGVHITAKSPSGQYFELQFHSKESLAVKNKIHPLYEESRIVGIPQDKYDALTRQMKEITDSLPDPKGVDKIQNYKSKEG
jgi:SPP1 gp7 family putative phage head morphogenesis protein